MPLIEEIIKDESLSVISFVLGPAMTNAYLVGDPETKQAVVIDPAWEGEVITREAERRGWRIRELFLTHGHFDHFGGAAAIAEASKESIPVALHPDDKSLWQLNGGATLFGFPSFDPGPEPSIHLQHGMELRLGNHSFEVRHTPGHTQGHVMFLASKAAVAFCGDLIFMGSVGRTDLPGGDWQTLLQSIQAEVLSLPDETRLLSGHGPATTVGQERRTNPFLLGDF
jgi:glyoxylase-like metal-dependent hydrolase (beta-lactamase superfamily II)